MATVPSEPEPIPADLLLRAYRVGIFPMADALDDPEVFWVEPRQRAILPLDGFHLSHSLARTLRRERFRVTCNAAFDRVIEACAAPRPGETGGDAEGGGGGTWISHRIAASYRDLHRLGHAHSIECWQGEALVGGLYGVGFDAVFCGESMFSRVPDASKVALAWLVAALRRAGAVLLDCQFMTGHLASLGAIEITQEQYVERLLAATRAYQAGGACSAGASGSGASSGSAAGALPLSAGFAALLDDCAGLDCSPGKRIAQSLIHTS